MSRPNATVWTQDLEATLDYLEGLVVILKSLDREQRGYGGGDQLLDALGEMDSHGHNWEPLRYQSSVGTGWQYVADSVADLRARLLEGYADAAL